MHKKKNILFFITSYFLTTQVFAWNIFPTNAEKLKNKLEEVCAKLDRDYDMLDYNINHGRVVIRHELFATLKKLYKHEILLYNLSVKAVEENKRLSAQGESDRITYPLLRKKRDYNNLQSIKLVSNFKIPEPKLLDSLIKMAELETTTEAQQQLELVEEVTIIPPPSYEEAMRDRPTVVGIPVYIDPNQSVPFAHPVVTEDYSGYVSISR